MPIETKKFNKEGKELAIRFGLGGIKAVGVGMIDDMVKRREKNGKFTNIHDFAQKAGTKVINKKSLEALAKSGSFDKIANNRHQIIGSVEILCKFASAKEEEKNSAQMSLFSAAKIEEKLPDLAKAQQWDKKTKLQEEFNAFGFFLGEHPIDDRLSDLKKRGVVFSEKITELNDGALAKFAGVVAYSKHKSGPRGRYAYVAVSDPFGIYETAIFDEALITQNRDLLENGSSLVMGCLLKKDEGGSRILVREIYKLENFLKEFPAKKEEYEEITYQKPKNYDWKKRKGEEKDISQDILISQKRREEKINFLKAEKILTQAEIIISTREELFSLKSFLSDKIFNEEFKDFTTGTEIFVRQGSQKIILGDKYLITEKQLTKFQEKLSAKA